MNSESACVSEKKPFCVETLSFENVPNQSRLFLDFEADLPKVAIFYPEKLNDAFIGKILQNYKTDRIALCNALESSNKTFGAGEKTFENIKLLSEQDCVAIVTGQQAGLFTGALYTIYKILSAIRLANDLRNKNIKAVPVFWIAEEDHDFDEVKKTFLLNHSGEMVRIENEPQTFEENSPVGYVEFDESIEETKRQVFEELQPVEFTGELQNLLAETYRRDETYSSAFAKFLTKIFGKFGLIILSPLDAELKKLTSPILAEAIKKSDEIREALLNRTAELEAAKYHAQVLVEKDFFPFFLTENKKRFAIKKNADGTYQTKKAKHAFTLDELIKIAETEPQRLSPNALMRSVVQDYLLPTAQYFGGAAEIAYFAQNVEIYRALNRPVTPIVHRASYTIVEPRNRRTLEKYELQLTDLFAGQAEISARIVNKFIANDVAEKFAETEQIFNSQLSDLEKKLTESEPTLSAGLETRRRKIQYHVSAMLKKFQRAELQKNETLSRRLDFLFASLLPHKALQERSLNVLYFLNLYGENFIDWIYESINSDEKGHQIFYL